MKDSIKPAIIWFRKDLRLEGHLALHYAIKQGKPIVFLYVLDEDSMGKWKMGSAQKVWLHHSLSALEENLKSHKGHLLLRKGDTISSLEDVIKKTGADTLLFHRCYDPADLALEKKVKSHFKDLEVTSFLSYLLFEPWVIKNKQGKHFSVFTPFSKACLEKLELKEPLPNKAFHPFPHSVKGDKLTSWRLLPTKPDWSGGFDEVWEPGEEGAHKKLKRFISHSLEKYDTGRDFPALEATSKLSPHLHFGEITPIQILQELAKLPRKTKQQEKFISEILWREFAYHLLYHFPQLPEEPFQEKFKGFVWEKNTKELHAWEKGMTGYPLIDAGMRELWHTGWMHNRVRMVVASFLVKDLFIHWKEGEKWFWDTLVDADLANNSASWQWVAGSGADAAPYFRIFNPVTQSEKFDPEGEYIRKWVPELKGLSSKYIHAPWLAPAEALKAAKITLGSTYPEPLVDHDERRKKALDLYKEL